MKFKALVFVLLLVLLSGFVSSEIIVETYSSGFFSGAKLSEPSICLCGSLIDEVFIRNTAIFPQVFEISSTNPRASIGVNQVTLLPGEEIFIPISLSASCSENVGVEDYSVFIRSTTGVEQVIKRNLLLEDCQTIEASLFSNKNESNICKEVVYSIKLSNPSSFREDYLVGPVSNIDFFDVKGYSVSLNPGQVSVLNFSFMPSCDVSGVVSNEFRIDASLSDLSARLNHDLFINPGYDFSVSGDFDLGICRYDKISIPYTISNDGLVANNYSISLQNRPNYAELTLDYLFLEPGESGTFHILFNPNQKSLAKNFSLIVVSDLGDLEVVRDVSVFLDDCYDISLSILSPDSFNFCQGTHDLSVLLVNNGPYVESLSLETNTPLAYLSTSSVTLNPGEDLLLDLFISAEEFVGDIFFDVRAISERDLSINWSDSITLNFASERDCSRIDFQRRSVIYSRVYEDVVNVWVKNGGVEGDEFKISYQGSPFLNLTENLTFIEAGDSFLVVLNKTFEPELDVYYFDLNFTSSSGEVYSNTFKLVITTTPFFEEVFDYAQKNTCFFFALIIFVITLLFLLSLLVFGSFLTKFFRLFLFFVLIVIVIVLLFIHGFPDRVNPALIQSTDPYSLRFYEGKSFVVDLNDYVLDPDNDTLSFSIVDVPSDINLELVDDVIVLSSSNWTGTDRFRVLADDNRSGVVVTPRFNVEVVEYTKLSFIDWYEFYCIFINMFFLLLLALFVLLSGNKKKVKKERTKKVRIKKSDTRSKKVSVSSKKSASTRKKTFKKRAKTLKK
jgi:hypothetical protein